MRSWYFVLVAERQALSTVQLSKQPMASGIAARGWRGFGEWTWRGGWRYWLEDPLLLVAGLWLPFVLLGWVPAVSGFTMEMVSFSLRMLVAYLLFVGALWTLERVTAARKRE